MGLALGTFRNRKPYAAADFPAPVSPVGAKTMLWDGEQTAAFLAGAPVPALPDSDDDEDLLERIEAAAVLGVAPDTWNHYKRDPRIARHLVSVKGVEHCPRRILRAFREARPGGGCAPARAAATWCPATSWMPGSVNCWRPIRR
ncbi:hypothetical protein [Streptomyces sp. KL116D]|uniref:hypothetical protein n=1 Tax=Streptomyces sp. KL116D TaxID=3045152 RepID=UPI003557FD7B